MRTTHKLAYRGPFDWESLLAFLRARAIDGLESVDGEAYRRNIAVDGEFGSMEVRHVLQERSLSVAVNLPKPEHQNILQRVTRVFDLDADIETINCHLRQDSMLAPLILMRPGLRRPGGWDGFELAVRAILGQQITVSAARRLGGILVSKWGFGAFPTAASLAHADLSELPAPASRKAALKSLALAVLDDPALFDPTRHLDEAIKRLRQICGVGEWTAQYIALRAMRHPDAFPDTDVAILRGAEAVLSYRPSPTELRDRAECWRPWRSYAAQHLWAAT